MTIDYVLIGMNFGIALLFWFMGFGFRKALETFGIFFE